MNECELGTHNCTQICNDLIGSYSCDCITGYVLASNKLTCSSKPIFSKFVTIINIYTKHLTAKILMITVALFNVAFGTNY